MTDKIELSEAQERALRMVFRYTHGNSETVRGSNHWNDDGRSPRIPTGILKALATKGLVERAWRSEYFITDDGCRHLQELNGMGGGTEMPQFKLGDTVVFQDYGGKMEEGTIFAMDVPETFSRFYDIQKPNGDISLSIAEHHILDKQASEAAHDEYAGSLDALVGDLAEARDKVVSVKEAYEKALAKHPELAALQQSLKAVKEAEQQAYDALASAAVEAFKETGDKQPHEKVTIKLMTRREYDYDAAEVWAQNNARYMLVLDTKQFENALKSGLTLDFVTTTEEPKAYIAKDLSDNG